MSSAHTVRITTDTRQKLKVLAYINDTSMTAMVTHLVDNYIEAGAETGVQGAMWKMMSAQITYAREKEKQNG